MTNVWTPKTAAALYYWRGIKKYDFPFIADLMKREFGIQVTNRSCIGKFHRLVNKAYTYDPKMIKEYL